MRRMMMITNWEDYRVYANLGVVLFRLGLCEGTDGGSSWGIVNEDDAQHYLYITTEK